MKAPKNIDVLFVAGFGPIVRDPVASRKFYSEALGLPFKEDANGYLHTGSLKGVKHFALWPLAQAAESCFGTDQWPGNLQCGGEALPPLAPVASRLIPSGNLPDRWSGAAEGRARP